MVAVITLVLIGFVGGLITGISPCVLPVLPVVFLTGGAGDSRRRPYLIVAGLALSFATVTLLGTLIVSVLPIPADAIRWAGLAVLVLLGIAMMFPAVQDLLERPFARLGARRVDGGQGGFVLGLALGAVYVPCAGPVLAAITIAGASGRIGWHTVALTLAFAVGTAVPLLAFALAGRGVAQRVTAFRRHQRAVRFAAGVVVIALAIGLTFNLTDVLQRDIPDYTAGLNTAVGAGVGQQLGAPQNEGLAECANSGALTLQDCGPMPTIAGIQQWLNTPGGGAVTAAQLKGKVVLVDFWAYSCINCQRAIPHIEAWYTDYQKDGLVVIGVHTPEYAFEHVPGNVAAGASRLHITYPVALDNDDVTWNNFANEAWPADYLVDSTGEVRFASLGEGAYDSTEGLIRGLLSAAQPNVALPSPVDVPDQTPQEATTEETYLGAQRADAFVDGPLADGTQTFEYPSTVPPDEFALSGAWTVGDESLMSGSAAGIRLSFQAKDVYLDVGGTGTVAATVDGKTTSFHIAGAPDIYPVVDSTQSDRSTLTLTLSPGLSAYSFTFG